MLCWMLALTSQTHRRWIRPWWWTNLQRFVGEIESGPWGMVGWGALRLLAPSPPQYPAEAVEEGAAGRGACPRTMRCAASLCSREWSDAVERTTMSSFYPACRHVREALMACRLLLRLLAGSAGSWSGENIWRR